VVVADEQELAGLRDEWNEATAATAAPNVYLTWEWTHTWWSHFGGTNDLHVVVVRDADGIVAIAPLQRSRVGAGRFVTPLLERISPEAGDYGGVVLVRREHDAVEAIVGHIERLIRRRWVTAVVLSRLGEDGPLLPLLQDALARRAGSLAGSETKLDGACLVTDVRGDFDLDRQARKHRIAQRLRRLREQHTDVTFTYHSGDDLQVGLDRLLEVHAQRWAGRESELRGLLADADRAAFMLDAVRALDRQGWVRLLTLTADGHPVAAELDFAYQGRLFMFKGAFDPDYSSFAPGQILFNRVIADELASGLELVEWGRGDQPYKRRWANGERHQVTVTITRSGVAGRLGAQRLRATRALDRRIHPDHHDGGPGGSGAETGPGNEIGLGLGPYQPAEVGSDGKSDSEAAAAS